VQDPATTWIDIRSSLAEDVELLPGTHIAGATSVARGARIGPQTTLVDCEVGENATVSRSDVTLAVIGPGASVGPFAYLRPGTELAENGKIGTFVETKNAKIGAGSKVPHLSYMGDVTIGEGTNIGAGGVTANYDDIAKHPTTIGSHVHTGVHNVFVAPVTIGDGAKVGAGAVIRKDVPPGARDQRRPAAQHRGLDREESGGNRVGRCRIPRRYRGHRLRRGRRSATQ
jgi:bifunctional UDP-N-acetylglucosamine pyrophosphorylase/glucosamine-1-phosphate N-acetyltransferase